MANEKKKRGRWLWFLGGAILFVVGMFFLAGIFVIRFAPDVMAYSPVGKKIAVVDIRGTIVESEGTVELLRSYRDDDNVAAVILYIDSPGGGVAPTQEIYDAIMDLKKTKHKKVYAYISSLGASGGYYIACAADRVYAAPGALTGSIGVIFTFTNVEGLFDKVGLSTKVVKSGRYKDIGSPFRPMTPEEEMLLGETVTDVYEQFLDAVVEGRKAAVTKKLVAAGEKNPTKYRVRRYVMDYADGRIFSGRQAQRWGFVDETGTFGACLKATARDVGIKGEPTVIRRKPKKERSEGLFGLLKTKLGVEALPGPGIEMRYSIY